MFWLRAVHWLVMRRGSVACSRCEYLAEEIALIPRSVATLWLRDGLVVALDSPATTRLAPLGFLGQSNCAHRVAWMLVNELKKSPAAESH
ncbi:hypothetical protein [Phaeobacter gallaeciensis]|uniref:hypothetical protein n=1 Tax=Phaeobacter gallaeciensis TaxID=60890 RepID=UPI00237FAE1F|nr:hypothetical protein [Phaeobacter gallaeciensis]MDE4063436.1 hypothetical protein [Phaeobacter gallaeciensis]MDE4126446.1 hypothetical protein [Phaeobacter gallaeciensis]MDE4130934.1 hypothetical protein [Phaeobacter gallaeciensis]